MSVLDDYKQPASLGQMIINRAAMGARQRQIGEKRNAQSAVVAELRQTYEEAKETYKEVLRASVLGTRSQEETEEARALRDQLKERLEAETEMLEAYQQAMAELMDTIGADYNAIEMEKRRINREFADKHLKEITARIDAAVADYIAVRYLCGRIDVAAQELFQRVSVVEISAVKAAKVAARSLDAIPEQQADAA